MRSLSCRALIPIIFAPTLNSACLVRRSVLTFWSTVSLTWASLGVIYGDIGTSPLYVFSSIFVDFTPNVVDLLGATSLIFWSLTLVVLCKYVLIVLRAGDQGEGERMRLWLICAHSSGIIIHLVPGGPYLQAARLRSTRVSAARWASRPAARSLRRRRTTR